MNVDIAAPADRAAGSRQNQEDQWPFAQCAGLEHAALAGIKHRGSRRTSAKKSGRA